MSLIKTRLSTRYNGIYVFVNAFGKISAQDKIDGVISGIGTCCSVIIAKRRNKTNKIKENTTFNVSFKGDVTSNSANIKSSCCDKCQGENVETQNEHDIEELPCSVCDEVRNITNYCLTCNSLTCSQCEQDHQSGEHEFVKHDRKSGMEAHETCPKHKKYDLDLFCLQCKTYICVACKVISHVNHYCFDLKYMYDTNFVKPEKYIDDEKTHKSLNYNLNVEQTVSIATGVFWNKSTTTENVKCVCLTFPI
jgi:hypothetical protein